LATKGADFQSALMSVSARKLKMLFNKARRHRPCIVFIDEFDSIGERRNYAGTGIDKENNRLITTMLNEMDGFVPYSGMLVIAATNSYASLDPALIRPGRFDLKYTIGNPDSATRAELVQMYTKGKNLSDELSSDMLVAAFDGQSCAAIEAVLNEAQAICQMTGEQTINIGILTDAAQKAGVKLNIKNRK
ncbi:MAG: 26S protease regulatory subunit, partial [Spirochaetales bacterium]|nr:26S protease regulatory subunit [Spirochaetales bacterium]